MAQKVRPAADVSTSGWTPTPVYAEIDEASPDDGTFVEASVGTAVFTVKLARPAAPVVGADEPAHVLTVRIDGPSPVLIELLQGATLIASRVCDAPDGFADYTLTLTRAEAARIDYAPGPDGDPDLRVRVSAVSATVAPNQSLPVAVPVTGDAVCTFTTPTLPPYAQVTLVQFVLDHGGSIGPLTLTLTEPNGTPVTLTLIQQLPNGTGTCTATGFLVLLSAAGASGIQGVNQSSGTITGVYQPAQAFTGFTGDPNGTWTATLTNAGANTGSITSMLLGFGTPVAPLVVVPTAMPSSGSSPLGISLDAVITGGTAALVKIDWDDGSPVAWVAPASLPVTHTYAAGAYEPTVTAYTASGGGSSGAAPVTVSPTTTTYSTAGSHTWTAPAGVTSITVECWGGGGAGAAAAGGGGGGGGGGAYSKAIVSVTPGNNYAVAVGVGGPSPSGTGNDSTFNATSVVAKGGTGASTGTGGTGGAAASGTGTVKYSGGAGANASGSDGGGGGSSAGTAANGNSASGTTGGVAPTGGGAGGTGGTAGGNGTAGSAPGGGGGGCSSAGSAAGAGAVGQVKLTW